MTNIRLLDCTLRDGGYVNDWQFGERQIKEIISKLVLSKVDVIECGFLSQMGVYNKDKTIFPSLDNLKDYIPLEHNCCNIACMINYGEYNIDDIPQCNNSIINSIRVAFHKDDVNEAIEFCKKLKLKNYNVYVQPMVTLSYTDLEIIELIENVNSFSPIAFYIVDTFGMMRKKDVMRLFYLFDNNLNNNIAIGFHSHNNMQLSFSNAQELMSLSTSREIIIDSSVLGMGRGAGNLCTELLAQYINENIEDKYNLMSILEIVDEYINPIYLKCSWGYSVPYFIASVNNCHPSYATYLVNKQAMSVKEINSIIESINPNKRTLFDEIYIEKLYIQYQEHGVDDKSSIEELTRICKNKTVLLIAPGKTVETYKDQIDKYICQEKPVVISVNFLPDKFNVDALFISNLKRFSGIKAVLDKTNRDIKVFFTSNISTQITDNMFVLNYSSYLNDDCNVSDNAGLMCINVISSIDIKKLVLAGFDGFGFKKLDNYFNEDFINSVDIEKYINMNVAFSNRLQQIKKNVDVTFLTKSKYEKND